jgi:hypothetical protein
MAKNKAGVTKRRVKAEHVSSGDDDSEAEEEKARARVMRKRRKRRQREESDSDTEDEDENGKKKDVRVLCLSCGPEFRVTGCSLVFCVSWVIALAGIWTFRPALSFTLLTLMIPFIPMFIWWFRNRKTVSLDDVILYFAAGFFPGFIAVYFFQYIFSMLILGFHFGATRMQFAPYPEEFYGPFEYVLLTLASYFALALPEAGMKVYLARTIINENPPSKSRLMFSVSFALGFAAAQSILLTLITHGAAHLFNVWAVVQTAAICSLFGTPLHCLDAYLISIGVVMKQKYKGKTGLFGIIFLPVLARGTVILQALIFLYKGPYHGWLALPPAAFITLLVFVYTKVVEKQLPLEYRQKVGYMNVLGLSTLPESVASSSRLGVVPPSNSSFAGDRGVPTGESKAPI